MYQELIDQIVVLMEEMLKDLKAKGTDPVRGLYGVYRDVGMRVGVRIRELIAEAKAKEG